jgi:hypothetical protein
MDNETAVGHTVALDCRITRRKYYHLVVSPDGEVVFRSKLLGAVLEWLDAEGIANVDFITDDSRYRARVVRAR